MVTVDDYGRIRLAHRDGMSIRAIGTAYGYSRQTVRKALEQAEPPPYTLTRPRAAPVLGAYYALIDDILAADEQAPRKQRHTAMQVFRRLRDEQGYAGGYDAVRRYVAGRRQQARETFIPLDHAAGQRMEVDFGHIHVDLPEERRLVPVLLCTWGYSNAPFAMALPTERTEAVLAGMVAAIEFFGAVAKQVWWDNPPTVVTKVLKGRERIYHERWRALASHYRFEACACMPGRGNEKPRVENRVYDLQRRWATPVPRVADLAQLNEHLRACCLREREHTIRGRDGSIGQRLAADQAAGVPLPATPFLPVVYQEARVDKYQSVRFDNVTYSVPRQLAFQAVTVRASIDWVEVVVANRVLARHPRCYKPDYQSLDPRHYLPNLVRRSGALDNSPLFGQLHLPPVFADVREVLDRREGTNRGRRAFAQLLLLLTDHPLPEVTKVLTQWRQRHPDQIDVGAIRLAVERRGLTADAPLGPWPQVDVPLPDLRCFDQLLRQGEPNHA